MKRLATAADLNAEYSGEGMMVSTGAAGDAPTKLRNANTENTGEESGELSLIIRCRHVSSVGQ